MHQWRHKKLLEVKLQLRKCRLLQFQCSRIFLMSVVYKDRHRNKFQNLQGKYRLSNRKSTRGEEL